MPYGCANKKMLAVMYVLDGEVMVNEVRPLLGWPCFEKDHQDTETKYTKNSPVPCPDQQQIHLLYLMGPSLISTLALEKVMVPWKVCYAYLD